MERKFRIWRIVLPAMLLAALLLGISVIGADDTASDPLVSLGYLNGAYRTGILSELDAKLQQATASQTEKMTKQVEAVKAAAANQQNVQPTHTTVTVAAGTSYTAPTGSEFLVLSGVLDCGSATLTDTASGTSVSAQALLEVNHLYIATASTVLRATETAQILIRRP